MGSWKAARQGVHLGRDHRGRTNREVLLYLLRAGYGLRVDEVSKDKGLPPAKVREALAALEAEGLAVETEDAMFRASPAAEAVWALAESEVGAAFDGG